METLRGSSSSIGMHVKLFAGVAAKTPFRIVCRPQIHFEIVHEGCIVALLATATLRTEGATGIFRDNWQVLPDAKS